MTGRRFITGITDVKHTISITDMTEFTKSTQNNITSNASSNVYAVQLIIDVDLTRLLNTLSFSASDEELLQTFGASVTLARIVDLFRTGVTSFSQSAEDLPLQGAFRTFNAAGTLVSTQPNWLRFWQALLTAAADGQNIDSNALQNDLSIVDLQDISRGVWTNAPDIWAWTLSMRRDSAPGSLVDSSLFTAAAENIGRRTFVDDNTFGLTFQENESIDFSISFDTMNGGRVTGRIVLRAV